MEMVWKGSDILGNSSWLFTGALFRPNTFSSMSPNSVEVAMVKALIKLDLILKFVTKTLPQPGISITPD